MKISLAELLLAVSFQHLCYSVVSSATDEVVVTHLPLHPLTSLTFFNGEVSSYGVLGSQIKWPGATTSKSYVSLNPSAAGDVQKGEF